MSFWGNMTKALLLADIVTEKLGGILANHPVHVHVHLVWEEHRANRSDKGCRTVAAFKAHYFADW